MHMVWMHINLHLNGIYILFETWLYSQTYTYTGVVTLVHWPRWPISLHVDLVFPVWPHLLSCSHLLPHAFKHRANTINERELAWIQLRPCVLLHIHSQNCVSCSLYKKERLVAFRPFANPSLVRQTCPHKWLVIVPVYILYGLIMNKYCRER